MLYFPYARNIFINADNYLDGFLGLRWAPSDESKGKVKSYENAVAPLLFRLWNCHPSAYVIYEIARASTKRVDIMPPQFSPDAFPKDKQNAFTGTKDNNYVDASKKGTEGVTCLPEKKSDRVTATGLGASAVIAFNPFEWGKAGVTGPLGPGSSPDEILFHELVHAMRHVCGQRNICYGAPNGWGDFEEFLAVVICNVYSCMTNRPLRQGVQGFKPLPANLSTSQAFFTAYKDYLLPILTEHPQLCDALKKDTALSFNPFTLM